MEKEKNPGRVPNSPSEGIEMPLNSSTSKEISKNIAAAQSTHSSKKKLTAKDNVSEVPTKKIQYYHGINENPSKDEAAKSETASDGSKNNASLSKTSVSQADKVNRSPRALKPEDESNKSATSKLNDAKEVGQKKVGNTEKHKDDSKALHKLEESQGAAKAENYDGGSQREEGYTSTMDDELDNCLSSSTQSQTPPLNLRATTTTKISTSETTTTATNATAAVATAMGVAASVVTAAAGINTTIPDTILSPPKSETQTDDANTATSSSSPASDTQLSPGGTPTGAAMGVPGSDAITTKTKLPEAPQITTTIGSVVEETAANTAINAATDVAAAAAKISPKTLATKRPASASVAKNEESGATGKRVVQPINVIANGTIPKSSGKPHMLAMNKKLKEKAARTPRQRKPKSIVAIYESELSDNKTGIKLCIKKSDSAGNAANITTGASIPYTAGAKSSAATSTASTAAGKQVRKRSRKSKSKARLDSDESEIEITTGGKRGKKERSSNVTERQKKASHTSTEEQGEKHRASIEQGDWGARIPQEILYKIFEILIDREGCLPTLCRLGRVCSLWRNVSLTPTLWKSMDLTTWIKEKYRTELKLKWFVDNRCSECTELNVANWKMTDINCFLNKLAVGCPNLTSITLSGWKGFTSDHLAYLTDNMQKLQRLDLSSVNVEMNASKSAVGPQSLCNALQTMGSRLTHIYLAHNRLAGIPQIVTILSTHCPNLTNLDLSNVTTQATSHGIFHIEKLQHGCPKLKVLRVTNSHITWSNASLQETMDSPGFPDLEELSVAALTDESRVIGDDHLQRILKTSSKLKLLDVRGCARLTHESLIRLPAWDIKHLFLSGCSVTRDVGSGLELIASKWAHSLIELDLAWANVQQPLDNALRALAEKGSESPLAHLNLCGSSVSYEAVKEILANCAHMSSINLSSCRGLPRGVKRLMQGQQELQELREVLKVQMKVKLPAQIKLEQEEEQRKQRAAEQSGSGSGSAVSAGEDGGGGGGGGGLGAGNSQAN